MKNKITDLCTHWIGPKRYLHSLHLCPGTTHHIAIGDGPTPVVSAKDFGLWKLAQLHFQAIVTSLKVHSWRPLSLPVTHLKLSMAQGATRVWKNSFCTKKWKQRPLVGGWLVSPSWTRQAEPSCHMNSRMSRKSQTQNNQPPSSSFNYTHEKCATTSTYAIGRRPSSKELKDHL